MIKSTMEITDCYTETTRGIVIVDEADHITIRFFLKESEEFYDHQYAKDEFSLVPAYEDVVWCEIRMKVEKER